jgi:hypothetical protein
MLYILHCANHPELSYREGQRPIVHLQADLRSVVRYAEREGVRWAFSNTNAGARYADFYRSLDDLNKIDWNAVEARDFRPVEVKEGKQAEFLVYESFPWSLVERIGVADQSVLRQVQSALARAEHRPRVSVQRGWYF